MSKLTTFADYQKVPAINWSTLKEVKKSALHYRYLLDNPREDSVRFALGRGAHTAVLEPMRFLRDYALFSGKVRRGKEWDAFAEANASKTILKDAEYQRCLDIADAIRSHPVASKYLAKGEAEQVLTWDDPITGLKCKARPDWMCSAATVDIKTAKSVEIRQFSTAVARMGYHGQAAFYRAGRMLARIEEPKPFVIIAAELEPPHDVIVYELDEETLYAGERDYCEFLAKVKECQESGRWPGRSEKLESLAVPAWCFGDDEEMTATEMEAA